jgi:hypothetical protein
MTDRELMQMALHGLEMVSAIDRSFSQRETIRRLNDRLAQPEPVLEDPKFWVSTGMGHKRPLHVAPPKREWVGLTDDEFQACFDHADGTLGSLMYAIEAKLKEKNT